MIHVLNAIILTTDIKLGHWIISISTIFLNTFISRVRNKILLSLYKSSLSELTIWLITYFKIYAMKIKFLIILSVNFIKIISSCNCANMF